MGDLGVKRSRYSLSPNVGLRALCSFAGSFGASKASSALRLPPVNERARPSKAHHYRHDCSVGSGSSCTSDQATTGLRRTPSLSISASTTSPGFK